MTVHWNSRKGFVAGVNTTSTEDMKAGEEGTRAQMAERLWAMRKVPELRASVVHRGKKLITEPGYPPEQVVKAVAAILARNLTRPQK